MNLNLKFKYWSKDCKTNSEIEKLIEDSKIAYIFWNLIDNLLLIKLILIS